jgi:hypothetical protein
VASLIEIKRTVSGPSQSGAWIRKGVHSSKPVVVTCRVEAGHPLT